MFLVYFVSFLLAPDSRFAIAACLLCALVVTPYFTWLPTPLLMAGVVLLYSVLVFPDCLSCSVCATLIGE